MPCGRGKLAGASTRVESAVRLSMPRMRLVEEVWQAMGIAVRTGDLEAMGGTVSQGSQLVAVREAMKWFDGIRNSWLALWHAFRRSSACFERPAIIGATVRLCLTMYANVPLGDSTVKLTISESSQLP